MATIPITGFPTGPPTTTSITTTTSTTSSPPPPPPTTTSTTSTTTTSSPPPPTTTSTTSSTSNTTTSSTPPPTTTSTSTSTSAVVTTPPAVTPTTTQPSVVIQTSTQFISSTPGLAAASQTSTSSKSKGFFANTGAVAGVFSVAGLILLALAIALITNSIRRRRARKFDRELAAATLEAASAPQPVFLDDEDDEYGPAAGAGRSGYGGGGGDASGGYGQKEGGGYGQYSDVSSHGTFGQPAMSVGSHGETYNMREISPRGDGPGPGELFDPYAGAAGAAGIGVARARSGRVAGDGGYAAGLQDGGAPYAAFAAGGGQARHLDILEAAGMGAHAAGAGAGLSRGPSAAQYGGAYQPYPGAQQEYGNLDRSRSVQYQQQPQQGGYQQYEQQQQPQQQYQAYPAQQAQYPQQHQEPSYAPQQPHQQQQQQAQPAHSDASRYSVGGDDDDDAAYGGYVAEDAAPAHHGAEALPNPFGGEDLEEEGERRDSVVEEEPRRVLKVANE
ncbi:hypothetical protein BJ912DRAFT_1149866 [Pholiota molesta]|nr:hypothetical protein BJ912DRAFT_1149866 [Pholiota molesta]